MTGFFKKLMATGTALSLGLSAMAFADQSCNYNNCPPANNCGNGSWCDNIKFDASFLYWKVAGDELDYAYDITEADSIDPAHTLYRKRFHNVSGDYDPGFKIGLGIDLPCICWDTNLVWTHFDTKNTSHHDSAHRAGSDVHVAIPFFRGSEVQVDQGENVVASGSLNFKYDVVDLEFGKWICCNNCLLFRPHVGLRAADIREKFHSELDVFATTGTTTDLTDYQAHIKNEFKGVGVRAGLDTDLQLCEGWSVIGRAAASILWGNTKIRNEFSSLTIDNDDLVAASYETDHYRHSRVITDLSLGIRYRTCYCSCPIELEASWEHHYLFGQHRFFASDTIDESLEGYNYKKNGDVSLQGLTITATFEF